MDTLVDLAPLIVGVIALLGSIWVNSRTITAGNRARVAERRTDAYLKILALVEQEGRYEHARLYRSRPFEEYGISTEDVPRPPLAARIEAEALLVPFATPTVRDAHARWRKSTEAIEGEWFQLQENYPAEQLDERSLDLLDKGLVPAEKKRRKELGEAIAIEVAKGS